MKKILTLAVAVLFSIGLKAQTTLTTAVDFTAVDHYGNEINLFEILDGGQYVLIDFFFSSCSGCPEVTKNMVDAYYALGCNENDVFFMEISSSDDTYSAQQWIDTYSVPFPTIHNINPSGPGGITGPGMDINLSYDIQAWPTVVLIAPDRSIIYKDIYPVHSPSDIINPLVEAGLEEHECDGQEAKALIDIVKEKSTKIDVRFNPNSAAVSYYYMISEEGDLPIEAVQNEGTEQTGDYDHTFAGLESDKTYYIYTAAVDDLGNIEGFEVAEAATLCAGGEGMSVINISLSQSDGMLRAFAEPNEATSEYHYGFSAVPLYEENEIVEIDAIMHDNHPLCEVDEWLIPVLSFNETVDYYAIAIGMNGEGEWGDVCLTRFNINTVGVDEITMNKVEIYPNPATSNIHVKSDMNGEGQVSLIDMTGRCIKSVVISDMSDVTIDVEDVENGVYFVKVQQDGNCKISKVIIK